MWTINKIGDVLIWLCLFVVFPIVGYAFYSVIEINIAIWFILSAFVAVIITAFCSPIIMLLSLITEFLTKLSFKNA